MSVQALSMAFSVRGLSSSEKLVLLALANYANETMVCWPSQETLANDTELSSRTIWNALQSLEGRKVISRAKRKRADGTRASDVITLHFGSETAATDQLANPAKSTRKFCEDNSQILPNPLATVATLTTFEPSIDDPSGANAPSRRARDDFPNGAFDVWYELYPNKVGKHAARKAFEKVRKDGLATFAELTDGLRRYIRTKPPDRQWCNPATWLNQGRWSDEPATTTMTSNDRRAQPSSRFQDNLADAFAGSEIAMRAGRG